jgi:hypothetical protein
LKSYTVTNTYLGAFRQPSCSFSLPSTPCSGLHKIFPDLPHSRSATLRGTYWSSMNVLYNHPIKDTIQLHINWKCIFNPALHFFGGITRYWTLGLTLARQEFYHLNHASKSFLFRLFFRLGLAHLSGPALDCNTPTSASQVAGITCMQHYARP